MGNFFGGQPDSLENSATLQFARMDRNADAAIVVVGKCGRPIPQQFGIIQTSAQIANSRVRRRGSKTYCGLQNKAIPKRAKHSIKWRITWGSVLLCSLLALLRM